MRDDAPALISDKLEELRTDPGAHHWRTLYLMQCPSCPANARIPGEKLGQLMDGYLELGKTAVTLREVRRDVERRRNTRK